MFYSLISTKSPIISLTMTILWLGLSLAFCLANPDTEGTYLVSSIADITLYHLLVLACGIYLNSIMINQKIVGLNNYSIVVISSILLSAIPANEMSIKFLFAFFIIIHMSKKIMLIFNTSDSTIPEFELGLLSALTFIVHPVFIFVLVYSIVSTIISKANQWRDFMSILLGFLFGLSLKAVVLLMNDNLTHINDVFLLNKEFKSWSLSFSLSLVLEILLAGFAVFILNYYRNQADKLNVKIRVSYWTWAWMAILFFVSGNIIQNSIPTESLLLFSFLPIIVLSQLYFLKSKTEWVNDIILGVIIMISVLIRF